MVSILTIYLKTIDEVIKNCKFCSRNFYFSHGYFSGFLTSWKCFHGV